jgi:AcrR family transcriptional regulator
MNQTTTEPRQTDRRRAEIAAAARSLIAEQGFEGLRTRDIAERVGINIATLHYHVPSKEALVELVAQSLRDEFRAQYQRHSREGLSGIEELRLEFADFRETLTTNREAFIVLAELSSRGKRDEKIAAIMEPLKNFWHGMVAGLIARGCADGSFRQGLDPATTARVVIGGMVDSQRYSGDTIAIFDQVVTELETLLANSTPPKP